MESYFDGLLAGERTQLAELNQQLGAVNDRMSHVKKYADALSKLGQYTESRDNQIERLRALALDITLLEREVVELDEELEELKLVDRHIIKAKSERDEREKADQQARELEAWRKQIKQWQV